MAKELKKVTKKAKSTKATKLAKAANATKTTKLTKSTKATKTKKVKKATKTTKSTKIAKKELTAKDRKKVTGGEGAKWAIRKGAALAAFCPSMIAGHSLEGKKFASVEEAEQYLLDMGYSKSEIIKTIHLIAQQLVKLN